MLGSHINYIHVKVKLYILFYIYFLAVVVVVTAAAAGCSVAMYKGHWKKLLIFFKGCWIGVRGWWFGWMVSWLFWWWVGIHFIQFFLYIPYFIAIFSCKKKNNIKYNTHFFIFCIFFFVASSRLILWYGFSLYVYISFFCLLLRLLAFLFFYMLLPILGGICVVEK